MIFFIFITILKYLLLIWKKIILTKIFQIIIEKNEVTITPTNLPKKKDLTLATNYPDINLFFWSLTEFKEIPAISEMIVRTLLKTNKNL